MTRGNRQNQDTYSERESKPPPAGCVPLGPTEIFPGGVTEVAQTTSDTCCAVTAKVKEEAAVCGFQPTDRQSELATGTAGGIVALC